MNDKLKNYDPKDLMEYFNKEIKLPSEETINSYKDLEFELYKRTKKILKESLEVKEHFVGYLIKKFNSDPFATSKFSNEILRNLEDGSKTYLEYLKIVKPLLDNKDLVVLSVLSDIGENLTVIDRLICFFETCLDIVERDRKKSTGWRDY